MAKTIMQKNRTFLSDIIAAKGRGVMEVSDALAPKFGISKQAVYQRIIGKTPCEFEEIEELTNKVADELGIIITADKRKYESVLVRVV